jgi:hypothetical protein
VVTRAARTSGRFAAATLRTHGPSFPDLCSSAHVPCNARRISPRAGPRGPPSWAGGMFAKGSQRACQEPAKGSPGAIVQHPGRWRGGRARSGLRCGKPAGRPPLTALAAGTEPDPSPRCRPDGSPLRRCWR